MENLFLQISIIITVATVIGYVLKTLRQPIIPAYVLAGVILGPVLGLIKDPGAITTMSEIGIAFLLFIVGLEIDLTKLKDVGYVASIGGLINSALLFGSGVAIALAFHFKSAEAIYLGLAVAFSSTMVVIKILSDKKELDTVHGRILVGILLMEDVMAIVALSVISNATILDSVWKAAALGAAAYLMARLALPPLFRFAAQSQELLFLLSLSTCFAFSMLATLLGLSLVIGAFLAGVSLANLPYRVGIISRIRPLRDFFSTIFFVMLGMQVTVGSMGGLLWPFLAFFFLVVIAKPLIVMNTVRQFGYKKRTIFLTGISLAHISEFSLIIVALGYGSGIVSEAGLTLTTLLAIGTITVSSYLLKYDTSLYRWLSPHIRFLERYCEGDEALPKSEHQIVLCGYNRIGFSIARMLKQLNKSFLVVDYNPEMIKELSAAGIPSMYGDVGDAEVLERMELSGVSMVISTVPDVTDNLLLLQWTRERNKQAAVVVTASHLDEALHLYRQGADYVILPHFLGGEYVSRLIEQFSCDEGAVMSARLRHVEELELRKELGHECPPHD